MIHFLGLKIKNVFFITGNNVLRVGTNEMTTRRDDRDPCYGTAYSCVYLWKEVFNTARARVSS